MGLEKNASVSITTIGGRIYCAFQRYWSPTQYTALSCPSSKRDKILAMTNIHSRYTPPPNKQAIKKELEENLNLLNNMEIFFLKIDLEKSLFVSNPDFIAS